jgi:hypothetical protein
MLFSWPPSTTMEDILKAHRLEKSDIEPEALQMCLSGLYDTEAMERVARISATNKYLNSHGYPGLPLFPSKKSIWESESNSSSQTSTATHPIPNLKPKKKIIRKPKVEDDAANDEATTDCSPPAIHQNTHLPPSVLECMSDEDIQRGAKMGLSSEEYFIIKGDFGKLFDLELDQSSYYHMIKKCKTKKAIKLRSNKEESLKYLQNHIIQLARLKLKWFDKASGAASTPGSSKNRLIMKAQEISANNKGDCSRTFETGGDQNIKGAMDILKVMMAMYPPLPQLSPSTDTT